MHSPGDEVCYGVASCSLSETCRLVLVFTDPCGLITQLRRLQSALERQEALVETGTLTES